MTDEAKHGDRARSVYELHVIHPATSERHTQQLKNLLADLLLGGTLLGSPGNLFATITLEIVDRGTGTTVLSMSQRVEDAPGVVDLLDADLDKLDAARFAEEWGITRTA